MVAICDYLFEPVTVCDLFSLFYILFLVTLFVHSDLNYGSRCKDTNKYRKNKSLDNFLLFQKFVVSLQHETDIAFCLFKYREHRHVVALQHTFL